MTDGKSGKNPLEPQVAADGSKSFNVTAYKEAAAEAEKHATQQPPESHLIRDKIDAASKAAGEMVDGAKSKWSTISAQLGALVGEKTGLADLSRYMDQKQERSPAGYEEQLNAAINDSRTQGAAVQEVVKGMKI